jgi:hypothetical protein
MTIDNRIGLNIPQQAPPVGKSFYLNEKETAEWIERLPLANIGETSRRLSQVLQEFNHILVPHKKRLAATERFRQPVDYVVSNLGKHYLDAGFPLSDKSHNIADLNRELHAGLATSYKSAISDILPAKQGKSGQRQLSLALHRAIHHLSRIVLLSVLIYDRFPEGIWLELHSLHRMARQYDLDAFQVKDPLESQGIDSSIDQIYRRILLFCLASPYKFRQRDNLKIYDALLDWANYSRFSALNEAVSDSSIIVQQDMDVPPCQGSLNQRKGARHLIRLDVGDLIRKLREQIESQSAGDKLQGVDSLDKDILRQLIQLWSTEQKRAFMRTKLNFELQVAVGLGSISRLLRQSDKQQSEVTEGPVRSDDKGPSTAERDIEILPRFTLAYEARQNHTATRRNDIKEFRPNACDQDDSDPAGSIWEGRESRSGCADTFIFQTLNESAGGYCLNWSGDQIPKIQVGELIGIRSSLAHHQFGIGLVRWMKSYPEQRMQVGIQMIAPDATAVTAQKSPSTRPPQDCLLLPEVGTCGQPTSLVCPSFHFMAGDLLILEDHGRNREIRLTRQLESSGVISQFQFIYLNGPAYGKQTGNGQDEFDGDEDFELLRPIL